MSRFFNAAGSVIDRIRINSIAREERAGRTVWVKSRRPESAFLIRCANAFFRLADNPIAVWLPVERWREWEIGCFRMLNGDAFDAFPEGARTVCADDLPGESLCRALSVGTLDRGMMSAAGRELRRAHAHQCQHFGDGWSHGDPHLGNFVFDPSANRCRMIDFEVCHDRALSTEARHVDDLLVPLLDLCGRIDAERWVPFALAFLEGYDQPALSRALRNRLRLPTGIPRLWWAIRTGYVNRAHIEERLHALRSALG